MARLVRSQVEMEGRYEERWTLVEERVNGHLGALRAPIEGQAL